MLFFLPNILFRNSLYFNLLFSYYSRLLLSDYSHKFINKKMNLNREGIYSLELLSELFSKSALIP